MCHHETRGGGGTKGKVGLTLARAVPAALHTIDDFFLQLLPFLLLRQVIALPLLPLLIRSAVQHPAALCMPHLVVEAAGTGQEIYMPATLSNLTLFF